MWDQLILTLHIHSNHCTVIMTKALKVRSIRCLGVSPACNMAEHRRKKLFLGLVGRCVSMLVWVSFLNFLNETQQQTLKAC